MAGRTPINGDFETRPIPRDDCERLLIALREIGVPFDQDTPSSDPKSIAIMVGTISTVSFNFDKEGKYSSISLDDSW